VRPRAIRASTGIPCACARCSIASSSGIPYSHCAGSGESSGSVSGSGISCGATCSTVVNYGSTVTLTASPSAGAELWAWTGPCAGQGTTCSFTITSSTTINAEFDQASYTLTQSNRPAFFVTSSTGGLYCGSQTGAGTCSVTIPRGTNLTLTLSPNVPSGKGIDTVTWTGTGNDAACSNSTTCPISMFASHSFTVTYTLVCTSC